MRHIRALIEQSGGPSCPAGIAGEITITLAGTVVLADVDDDDERLYVTPESWARSALRSYATLNFAAPTGTCWRTMPPSRPSWMPWGRSLPGSRQVTVLRKASRAYPRFVGNRERESMAIVHCKYGANHGGYGKPDLACVLGVAYVAG